MIECINFKPLTKGTLMGFADLRLPKLGLEIFGCSLHQKNGKKWVNFPSKEYTNPQGERKFYQHVRFINPNHQNEFIKEALEAIEKKCHEEFSDKPQQTEEIPF